MAISMVLGGVVGTISALFLYTLEISTDFRESHKWIIWLLPLSGLLISFIYKKWRGNTRQSVNSGIHNDAKFINKFGV